MSILNTIPNKDSILVRWTPRTNREKQTIKQNGEWWFKVDERNISILIRSQNNKDLRWILKSQVVDK